MFSTAEYQHKFIAQLLEQDDPSFLAQLHSHGSDHKLESAQRMSVYRNNVIHSLSQAISDSYPVVLRLIGADLFNALAIEYVRKSLPSEASLLNYAADFADFLADHPSCQTLPFLADVARIEYLYIQCFHGSDATAITMSDLFNLEQDKLPQVIFKKHPNVFLFNTDQPALEIWTENLKDEVERIDLSIANQTYLLLYREQYQVVPMQLTASCFYFCQALMLGLCIEDAWNQAVKNSPEELADDEIYDLLGFLLQRPLFTQLFTQQSTD